MKKRNVFQNPELSQVFICIMKGINYPQKIASVLNKTPPTIVDQLTKLKKEGLIISKKEKFLNKTVYNVNWNKFEKVFLKFYNYKIEVMSKMYKDTLINPKVFEITKNLFGLSKKEFLKADPEKWKKESNNIVKKLFKERILRDMISSFFDTIPKYDLNITLNQALSLFFRSCSDNFMWKIYLSLSKKKDLNKIYKNKDLLSFMSSCFSLSQTDPSVGGFFIKNKDILKD